MYLSYASAWDVSDNQPQQRRDASRISHGGYHGSVPSVKITVRRLFSGMIHEVSCTATLRRPPRGTNQHRETTDAMSRRYHEKIVLQVTNRLQLVHVLFEMYRFPASSHRFRVLLCSVLSSLRRRTSNPNFSDTAPSRYAVAGISSFQRGPREEGKGKRRECIRTLHSILSLRLPTLQQPSSSIPLRHSPIIQPKHISVLREREPIYGLFLLTPLHSTYTPPCFPTPWNLPWIDPQSARFGTRILYA